MAGKKEMLAQVAAKTGVTWLLESLPGRSSLLILNYHRVGEAAATPYDSGTFSCNGAEFDWQIGWLKKHFPILNLRQALDVVHGRATPKHTSVLITFDDGYRDNYDVAVPVLRRHDLSATFFLPTAFVGTGSLPWWDEIAYMLKRTEQPRVRLIYPAKAEFDLADRPTAIRNVLNFYKQAGSLDTEQFLNDLAAATDRERPGATAERCFLNFDEAREMQVAGMSFGSHTHTHEILSKHTYARQLEELTVSRGILERELGGEIDTLAYPVGQPNCFSEDTYAALRAAKYSTAFSFYKGVNVPGSIAPLDVLRAGVDGESREIFRLRAAMYANAGRSLV